MIMMGGNKKKIAQMIVGRIGSSDSDNTPGSPVESESSEDKKEEAMNMKLEAAVDILKAVQSADAKGLKYALSAFYDACGAYDDEAE
jgi:hypothetical protein